MQDLTEKKQYEQKIVESEQWFRLLADYSTDMISRHTPEGIYTYVSPICEVLLGYEQQELIGKLAYDFFHPDHIQPVRANHAQVLEGPKITTISYLIRKKDESYIWFETTSRMVCDDDGLVKEIISVSRNITERKTAEIKLKEANELLHRLSTIDGLTEISNRRTFDASLEDHWRAASRSGISCSLILCDIDSFKSYNDTYGHQAGDACLIEVAYALKNALFRPLDLAARYGGEEFAIILPNTDNDAAMQIAERIRQMVIDLNIPHRRSKICPFITVSLGVATLVPNTVTTPELLVTFADKALYQAKVEGRNRSVAYKINEIEGG